jgi:hypothetical protein
LILQPDAVPPAFLARTRLARPNLQNTAFAGWCSDTLIATMRAVSISPGAARATPGWLLADGQQRTSGDRPENPMIFPGAHRLRMVFER